MATWLMVIQSGYVCNGAEDIFEDHVSEHHGWSDPAAAQRTWRASRTYRHGCWSPYENGRQETKDVSGSPEYRDLGISALITRVYFVLVPDEPLSKTAPTEHLVLANPENVEDREQTVENIEVIEVFEPGQGGGFDTFTDPSTGEPWTRANATAAVQWARLHGIDAEMSAEIFPATPADPRHAHGTKAEAQP